MRVERTGTTDDRPPFVPRVCSVPGCGKPYAGRGLCDNHWQQQWQKEKRMAAKLANPRECVSCGEPIPPTRRWKGQTSYCSRKCKTQAFVAAGKQTKCARRSYLKRNYGLTVEEVEEMAADGCDICGTTEWMGRYPSPHVDHDHTTGEVRGLLCHNCNLGIGYFHENPEVLRAAIDYLC